MNILIQQGRLIDASQQLDQITDLYISDGKIAAIGGAPVNFKADSTINAAGLIVTPGLVDLSARLREPGDAYKANINSELKAAVAGGITALACSPDTDPILDEPGLVEMLKHRAQQLHLTQVYPLGALTRQLAGKQLSELFELTNAGCVGFSQADNAITDTQVLWRSMEYAATYGYTLFLRAEDAFLAQNGVAHDGEVASRLGLKGISQHAETIAMTTLLQIAQATGAKLHICRLSSAEGVALVRQAKQQCLQITADVAAHQLHLTELDLGFFNSQMHLKPPLRTMRDLNAISQGLLDGTIDAICSDHTPVDDDAKLRPFAESEAGASGLELLLPLTLKWAQHAKFPLAKTLSLISHQPAKILGKASTDFKIGATADCCIFAENEYWQITPENLISQGKNSPFLGLELAGRVHHTLVDGRICYANPLARAHT